MYHGSRFANFSLTRPRHWGKTGLGRIRRQIRDEADTFPSGFFKWWELEKNTGTFRSI
jgi:hypothetical protein